MLLETLNEPSKIYTKLLSKYTDRSPVKNKKLKLEFYTYKLKSDESIQHAYDRLKYIAREIIVNDDNMRNTYKSEIIYSQLLESLPERYKTIIDAQRQQIDQKVEDKLIRLQVKESKLNKSGKKGKGKEITH